MPHENILSAFFFWTYPPLRLHPFATASLAIAIEEIPAAPVIAFHDALHATFGICLNPLHRFHKIPMPPRFFYEDAAPDIIALINTGLDVINMLYPTFKPRVRIDDQTSASEDAK